MIEAILKAPEIDETITFEGESYKIVANCLHSPANPFSVGSTKWHIIGKNKRSERRWLWCKKHGLFNVKCSKCLKERLT